MRKKSARVHQFSLFNTTEIAVFEMAIISRDWERGLHLCMMLRVHEVGLSGYLARSELKRHALKRDKCIVSITDPRDTVQILVITLN